MRQKRELGIKAKTNQARKYLIPIEVRRSGGYFVKLEAGKVPCCKLNFYNERLSGANFRDW